MNIELNYKELTLTETIERLKEILQTQQPYRYNDETIYNAINYLNVMTIMAEIKYADTVETIPIPNNPTNGDMIKAMFHITDNDIDEDLSTIYVYAKTRVLKGGSQDYLRKQITFRKDWWNIY